MGRVMLMFRGLVSPGQVLEGAMKDVEFKLFTPQGECRGATSLLSMGLHTESGVEGEIFVSAFPTSLEVGFSL